MPSSSPLPTLDELRAIRRPEDLFGAEGATQVEQRRLAQRRYRQLAAELHPDRGGDGRAFAIVAALWAEAERFLAAGTYGPDRFATVAVKAGGRTWHIDRRITAGPVCDVFECHDDGSRPVLFKIARRPADNDLVRNEAATLKRLHGELDPRMHPFLPDLTASVAVRQAGGLVRQANVFADLTGFRPLSDVRVAYPSGVDARDMAWMWRRLLCILEAVADCGIVHGAPIDTAILIHPALHGLVLCDWEFSVPVGQRLRAVPRKRGRYLESELREPTTESFDVFPAAQTMARLASMMPAPIRAHFRACALPQAARPTAGMLREPFDDLLERTYGPRKFRPFTLPERRTA